MREYSVLGYHLVDRTIEENRSYDILLGWPSITYPGNEKCQREGEASEAPDRALGRTTLGTGFDDGEVETKMLTRNQPATIARLWKAQELAELRHALDAQRSAVRPNLKVLLYSTIGSHYYKTQGLERRTVS